MLSSLYSKKLEEMTLSMDERKEHRLLLFKLQSNDFMENHMTLKQWRLADWITLCCFEKVVKNWQAPRSAILRKEETFKQFHSFRLLIINKMQNLF